MRRSLAGAVSAVLVAALTGCQAGPDDPPDVAASQLPSSDTNPVDRSELAQGGTLRWGINDFPAQWNPHHANGTVSTVGTVMEALLPTPFDLDTDARPRPDPDFVEDVDVRAEPQQTVTLRLNPDARWSDGTPITWRDYAQMAEALSGRDPEYQINSATGYQQITEVTRGADDFEVVIAFDRPFADYPALFHPLLPAAYTATPERFNTGYLDDIPVTAGPFTLEETDRTARTVTVVRDDDWWGEPALLDRIIYRAMGPDALDSAFQDGGVDVYALAIDAGSYERASSVPEGEVRAALAPDYRHITLNGESPALSDVDVRHAVFLGIDRTAVAESAFSAIGWPATVPNNRLLLPNQQGYADNSGPWGRHDPERAAELLEGAGWTSDGPGEVRTRGGTPLSLRYVVPQGFQPARNEAELVQAMLGDIGIQVEIEAVPADELFSGYVVPGNYDLVSFVNNGGGYPVSQSMQQWSDAVPDADGSPQWRTNVGRIGSPEIDAALAEAMATLDAAQALASVNEADRLLWEAGHTLPLYQRPELVAVRRDVANLGAAGFAAVDYDDIGFVE
ncbi:ABC transporter family substrate-binding protein [Marinitenerispora sediminis]|uniref:ABC transporter family substrate-binding protein n=1 Tax=Marinitenerispora sediminis TaxID=1931232 RepID=UPI001F3E0427|nr:ABC transporter family substrate-binding protein [Marinitenerispora sediminis]